MTRKKREGKRGGRNLHRKGKDHAKDTVYLYTGIQGGSGSACKNEWQADDPNRTRSLHCVNRPLHHWCKQFSEHSEQAFPGSGHTLKGTGQQPQEEEIRHLKRENELLRQERDILKSYQHLLTTPGLHISIY